MKIAVTSQNFRTVTPHAGRTRRFLVYQSDAGGEPVETNRLDLPKEMAMHDFHREGAHPLHDVDVLITASFGKGFERRMAQRGIRVVKSAKEDPLVAVRDFLAHPEPHTTGGRHRHGRGYGHRHGPGHGHGQTLHEVLAP